MSLEIILVNNADLVSQFFFPHMVRKDLLSLRQVSITARQALETTKVSQPDLSLDEKEVTITFKGIDLPFRRHIVKMNALEDLFDLTASLNCTREEIRQWEKDTPKMRDYLDYAATHPYSGRLALALIPFDYETAQIPAEGRCSLQSAIAHIYGEANEFQIAYYAKYYLPRYLKLILCHPNAAHLPNKIELEKLSTMSTSTPEKGD